MTTQVSWQCKQCYETCWIDAAGLLATLPAYRADAATCECGTPATTAQVHHMLEVSREHANVQG